MAKAFNNAPKTHEEVLRENAFKPGNPGGPGRPKGARSKLGEVFLDALLTDFTEHGVIAIETVRAEKPDQYLKVVASILPKEIEAGEQTLGILAELLMRIDGRTRNVIPTLEIMG